MTFMDVLAHEAAVAAAALHRAALHGTSLALGLVLLALSSSARATPDYPLVIDATYGTECPQLSRCLICHTSARGGQATAVQPFAQTLRRYGLVRARDAAGLQSALAMLAPTVDSDGDGEPDVDELMVCGNPSGEDLRGGPEYGCDGARLASRSPIDVPLALAALVLIAAVVRRRPARA